LDLNGEPAAELVVPVLEEHAGVGSAILLIGPRRRQRFRVGSAILLIGPRRRQRFLDAGAGGRAIAEYLVESFGGEVLPLLVIVALAA